jgi:TPR repeat protein
VQQEHGSYQQRDAAAEDDFNRSLAAVVDERLDRRQIERLTETDPDRCGQDHGNRTRGADCASDALGRLNRRLDQIISEGRTACRDFERRMGHAQPLSPAHSTPAAPPARAPTPDPANRAAEISARQRAPDSDAPSIAPVEPTPPLPVFAGPAPEPSAHHQQLHQIRNQIASLHQSYREALDALRRDVAALNRTVSEAMPRREIERLESQVRGLAERLDRLQHGPNSQPVFTGIEDHIAKLAEKLNSCDARLDRLDTIERGLSELRVCVDGIRHGGGRGGEQQLTHFDLPLEPGSAGFNAKPASAAKRIAASEAALAHLKPPAVETGGRLAAFAAAREAARSANLVNSLQAAKPSQAKKRAFLFGWPSKQAPETPPQTPSEAIEASAPNPARAAASTGRRVVGVLQTLLIAATFVVIVIGALQTTMDILRSRRPTPPPEATVQDVPKAPPPASVPGHTLLPPEHSSSDVVAAPEPPAAAVEPTVQSSHSPSLYAPATPAASGLPLVDLTGSLLPPLPASQPSPPAPAPPAAPSAAPPAASIGPRLQAAIAANEPAAQYEMGVRYAEGRGVARNLEQAVRWLERAANAGFVPAQTRLASLHEKGEGLKKDLEAARRLYRAAATKGNAKAMHNLAVLYAEGIDGTPDYTMAAYWFRKAAGYGVADSQYNLAVLYARGIGIEANLAESYKWFALAATSGDADAARKRDEVGARLDQQTLMAARLAAQTFVPQREPDEATNLKAPPGGWDRATAPPAKVRTGFLH